MRFVNGSEGYSITIFSKLFHNSRPDPMYRRQKSMLGVVKRWLCWAPYWKGSNMSCCLLQSNEPSQLCLGPEFCRHPQLKFKELTLTLSTSQCLAKLNKPQPLVELRELSNWQEGLLESIPL